jgi:two-component system, cell cycle response regulator
MTTAPPIRALLVTEQRIIADALALAFSEPGGALDRPVVLTESRAAPASSGRSSAVFDLGFLDLSAEGAAPLDVMVRFRAVAEHAPLVALVPDEAVGAQAVLAGAYDYLVTPTLDAATARRVVRSVIERRRLELALHTLEHNDSLTGLLNRRGFCGGAEPRLRQGWRGKGSWVLFLDIDGLRRINDRLGYASGNEALIAVAAALKGSIRGSDLAARIGGDEFCALLVDAGRDAARSVATRLQRKLDAFVQERRIPLSVTLGSARCEPKSTCTLDELMRAADEEVRTTREAAGATREAPARA